MGKNFLARLVHLHFLTGCVTPPVCIGNSKPVILSNGRKKERWATKMWSSAPCKVLIKMFEGKDCKNYFILMTYKLKFVGFSSLFLKYNIVFLDRDNVAFNSSGSQQCNGTAALPILVIHVKTCEGWYQSCSTSKELAEVKVVCWDVNCCDLSHCIVPMCCSLRNSLLCIIIFPSPERAAKVKTCSIFYLYQNLICQLLACPSLC